jgi:LmbE family N-acetylglucosaminyl deacetylase
MPTQGWEAFDEVKRVAVIAAHADDMETMMGGTLLYLRQRGIPVNLLLATAGDRGSNEPQWSRESLTTARRAEQQAVAERVGLERIVYLGHPDGELEPTLDLRAAIARFYRETQADTIFTFDPGGYLLNHPDHRAVGRTALDALIPASMALYHPEQLGADVERSIVKRIFLWTPAENTVLVDVTPQHDEKIALCLLHSSQFPEPARLDWLRRMDGERGKTLGVPYAEGFARHETF